VRFTLFYSLKTGQDEGWPVDETMPSLWNRMGG